MITALAAATVLATAIEPDVRVYGPHYQLECDTRRIVTLVIEPEQEPTFKLAELDCEVVEADGPVTPEEIEEEMPIWYLVPHDFASNTVVESK